MPHNSTKVNEGELTFNLNLASTQQTRSGYQITHTHGGVWGKLCHFLQVLPV